MFKAKGTAAPVVKILRAIDVKAQLRHHHLRRPRPRVVFICEEV